MAGKSITGNRERIPIRPSAESSKRVGIWIRVSTEDQAKGESPEHHERRARMYAEAKGWDIVRVYDLSGVSGKTVMGHPETTAMREDVAQGRITGLIFSKLARLARNTKELLEFAEYFKTHQADLISLQESIDTSSPAGRFFYTMIAGMAQWEREEIADRVSASVKVRATMGKSLGGAAPFGYRWQDDRLVPDPTEAPVRKLLYELFRTYGRLKTVARLLNEAGHRTRNGSQFSDTTVRRLVEDPTAMGSRRANYTKSLGEGRHWIKKPEDDWILTPVEPIVSEELWRECNALLKERAAGRKPARRAVHLFTGIAYCHCGQKMYVPSNSPKYICYRCRNKIPLNDLERVFVEQLKDFFLSPDDVARYLADADRALADKRALLESLETEQARLQVEMDKLYQLYLADQLTPTAFGARNRPLEERLAQISAELPRLQGEIDFMTIEHVSASEIASQAQGLYDRWPALPSADRRALVETIVQRIEIAQDDISFDLNYLPSSAELVTDKQRNFMGSSRRPS